MLSQFLGTLRYEFLMQVRRPAIWITLLLIGVLAVSLFLIDLGYAPHLLEMRDSSTLDNALLLVAIAQYLLPIGVGCLLADRLPQDRKVYVEELLTSMPVTVSARIWGKYCGSLLATLLPVLLLLMIGATYAFLSTFDLQIYPLTLLAFVGVALPGLCFVAAFSLACPHIIWVPIYQFLFIGYWFWGNLLDEGPIPSLSSTILTPVGRFIAAGVFNQRTIFVTDNAARATLIDGIASISALLTIATLVLIALVSLMKWQQTQQ